MNNEVANEAILNKFKLEVAKLPKEQQVKVMQRFYNLIYSGLDDKVFRLMATSIKYAKESESEGHENFQISHQDLKNLSHIQDHNRLLQQKK
ncbi:MAG: hypothetical protein HQM15_04260 [Deltaproteobacteria bacterium]|nr:hypothetical protein [Deltaproteobacteria bacterium]